MRRTLALLILAAAGCSTPATHGIVISRSYDPPSDVTTLQCVSYNSKGACMVEMPHTTHYDPTWTITFRGRDGDGQTDSFDTDVGEGTYNACHVGDQFINADTSSARCVR